MQSTITRAFRACARDGKYRHRLYKKMDSWGFWLGQSRRKRRGDEMTRKCINLVNFGVTPPPTQVLGLLLWGWEWIIYCCYKLSSSLNAQATSFMYRFSSLHSGLQATTIFVLSSSIRLASAKTRSCWCEYHAQHLYPCPAWDGYGSGTEARYADA